MPNIRAALNCPSTTFSLAWTDATYIRLAMVSLGGNASKNTEGIRAIHVYTNVLDNQLNRSNSIHNKDGRARVQQWMRKIFREE